jgi:hypothetical protein
MREDLSEMGITFFIVWTLIGGVFFFVTLILWRKGLRTRRWNTTVGRVLRSQVGLYSDSDGTSYIPEVTYEYTVNGVSYTSTRVGIGLQAILKRGCRRIVERFPADASITVYYAPDRSEDSVLIQGPSAIIVWLLAGAFFLFGFSLWGLIVNLL